MKNLLEGLFDFILKPILAGIVVGAILYIGVAFVVWEFPLSENYSFFIRYFTATITAIFGFLNLISPS